MNEREDFERILELKNEFQAGLISTELESRDIPHVVKSNFDKAYNGVFQFQHGWGYLLAPSRYREKIEKIYSDLEEDKNQNDRKK
ncbi:hypothetical protein [Halarsenatibacter silvermanii]|uniref:Signal transducing protein n=1 Tax=Halarsenatibacter silvermanii TaxID=321763 RepID=A0A1G9JLK4_9FIRM|nr:hypothetical protein [Halarsenatibacter silvermanii]SDL38166.1 hypothetical protein SAMN04488692_10425 [Halarsenatibacter silvermanii]